MKYGAGPLTTEHGRRESEKHVVPVEEVAPRSRLGRFPAKQVSHSGQGPHYFHCKNRSD